MTRHLNTAFWQAEHIGRIRNAIGRLLAGGNGAVSGGSQTLVLAIVGFAVHHDLGGSSFRARWRFRLFDVIVLAGCFDVFFGGARAFLWRFLRRGRQGQPEEGCR